MTESRSKKGFGCGVLKTGRRLIFISLLCFQAFAATAGAQFVNLTLAGSKATAHKEWVTQIAVAPAAKEFISSDIDGRITIRDSASGEVLREVLLPAPALTLSLTNNGSLLAAGDASGTVTLVETASGKIKNTFKADKTIVNATAFSADGNFLAAGGSEGVVRLWSVRDGKIAGEINPARGSVVSLAFANSQLVVGTIDFKARRGAIEIWDWQNKKVVRTFDEGTPAFRGLSVSPDGKLLAAANFRSASLLSIVPAEGDSSEISLHLLPDSDKPAPVAIWDIASGKRLALIDSELGARNVAFSSDGAMLACAGEHGAMLFDIKDRTFVEIGRVDSQTSVDAVAFSPDSQRLFVSREHEPLAATGAGGLDKLFDPFFMNLAMVAREGAAPTFTKAAGTKSLTGGSDIEIWQMERRTAAPDALIWNAVRADFNDRADEARKILEQVVKDYPNSGEAQRLYALFFATDDLKRLQSLLEQSVASDPNCIPCRRSLGDVEYKNGQLAEAAKDYEQVLKLKPDYGLVAGHLASVYGSLALASISAGNNEKNMSRAAEVLNRALTLRPGEEIYYSNLGSVYYFRGDFDKDIELLLTAQRLRPDHARLLQPGTRLSLQER